MIFILIFLLRFTNIEASAEGVASSASHLDGITCWKEEKYSKPGCYCFMDSCLEGVRYAYLKDGLPLPNLARNEPAENDTVSAEDILTTTAAVNTTEETSPASTTTQLISLYDLLDGSDIVAKEAVLEPDQWGVNIDRTISLKLSR